MEMVGTEAWVVEQSDQRSIRQVRTVAEFGAVVRAARQLRRWTQADLARHAGVSRRWIVALESGQAGRAELGRGLATLSALGMGLTVSLPVDAPVSRDDHPGESPRGEPFPQEPSMDLDDHLATFVTADTTFGGRPV